MIELAPHATMRDCAETAARSAIAWTPLATVRAARALAARSPRGAARGRSALVARRGAAAALRRRAASWSATTACAPACWTKLVVHRAALLRAARHPVRLRSRPRHPVDAGDRRSAGLSARPRRGALRRRRAHAGACLQIWRPARPRAHHGPLDGARRRGAARATPTRSCRCRCIGAGCGRAASTSRRCSREVDRREQSGVPVAHYRALKRVKATPQQVGLSQAARAQNVQGAFRVPADGKAEVAGRRLILVDDVLTSGATVDACARALLRAGAAQVDVLVFARVVAGPAIPYKVAKKRHRPDEQRRDLYHPLLPLLHRGQGAAEPQGRAIHRDRRQRRSGRAREDDRARQRPHDRAADLHRRRHVGGSDDCMRSSAPASSTRC